MKEYKPSNEDITFAKQVWDDVIKTQVLNPVLTKEAYKRMRGFDAISQTQAKMWLSAYFTYQYKEVVKDLIDLGIVGVDKTDTVEPQDSAASPLAKVSEIDTQSHEEVIDTTYVGIAEDTPPQNGERDSSELQRLEEEYENAQTPNEKRSLKYKINKLKKDAGSK